MWDTNVTLVNAGNPQVQEWVGLVNPRGELLFIGRHTRFNAGYSGALEAYRTLDALNRFEQRSRGSLQHQFSPRLQLDASASYSVSPTTDRLEIGTLPFVDIGSRTADAGGSMRLAASPRTSIEAEYRFQRMRFDRDEEQRAAFAFLNGGHAHSPAARVLYAVSRRVSVGGEWQYRHATLEGFDSSFGVQNVLGNASYQVGPATSVSGAVGGSRVEVHTTGATTWGPSVRAGLEHQVRRVAITARYFRSFVPSFSFGGLTGNQQFSAGVRAPLSAGGRLLAGGSTTFSRTSPVEELGVGFQVDSLSIQGTVAYQFAPWLRTEGFVTSTHQTSTARGNVDRLRIGIQFVTSKPVRIE
jgi:predicted porin